LIACRTLTEGFSFKRKVHSRRSNIPDNVITAALQNINNQEPGKGGERMSSHPAALTATFWTT
jgi:hypothetical protein